MTILFQRTMQEYIIAIINDLSTNSGSLNYLWSSLDSGFFLVFYNTIMRALQTQNELPKGTVTALIGSPFFICLIISRRQNS